MSRILVVEDQPSNIQMVTGILRGKDYLVSVATSGLRALEVLAAVRPDLILLDVMMPEVDGFETCVRIKAVPEWRDIPIIFLTARTEPADIVRGFELGAVDYVAKPFHAHELLARVNTHLSIDRLRKENERLIRAESELARHRSVAQMVAGVAHELNTPLGTINTAASLITRSLASPAMQALDQSPEARMVKEDLAGAGHLITRNVARAHKLVQDFKKVSVNQITDIRERVRLAEVVTETVHLFNVSERAVEVVVINHLSDQQREWLGYPGSLSQVLLNLLNNARQYAGGGKVELTLEDANGGFRIEVRDFGPGIPPENLSRIFEPFFTTGRGQGGSGLGLSIVHAIVTDHLKGTIAVESAMGQGTTFHLVFPREVPES